MPWSWKGRCGSWSCGGGFQGSPSECSHNSFATWSDTASSNAFITRRSHRAWSTPSPQSVGACTPFSNRSVIGEASISRLSRGRVFDTTSERIGGRRASVATAREPFLELRGDRLSLLLQIHQHFLGLRQRLTHSAVDLRKVSACSVERLFCARLERLDIETPLAQRVGDRS